MFRVIEYIFSEVDKHIEEDHLLTEYKLNALPNLYDLFVRLVKYLVGISLFSIATCCLFDSVMHKLVTQSAILQLDNKPEDRDQVVILFQDMLEVVTRDIMEDHVSK